MSLQANLLSRPSMTFSGSMENLSLLPLPTMVRFTRHLSVCLLDTLYKNY